MKPYTIAQAEVDLRAAIDAGDQERIERLGRLVDDLEEPRPAPTLLGAALWYAEQGLRVFPIAAGGKVPAIPSPHPRGSTERSECKGECGLDGHGCKDATTDFDKIRAWWERIPDANVGIATGHLIDVVDIDGHEGQRSRVTHWDSIFATVDADSIGKVLTPRRGGMHIYVPVTGDGNSTNIVPSVDYRGLGGYVVAPPSRTPDGTYRWLGGLKVDLLADKAA